MQIRVEGDTGRPQDAQEVVDAAVARAEALAAGDADRLTELRCIVTDAVDAGAGPEVFRMPMTQTWVRQAGRWLCLAGHAGPRLTSPGLRADW